MNLRKIAWSAVLLVCGLGAAAATASTVNHDTYAVLLDRHLNRGLVDYKGLQQDEGLLDQYLTALAAVSPDSLSSDERLAFYINAYNAWTLKLILSRYPDIESIKDLGTLFSSPWKKKIARIGGETLSLGYIEHEILRKEFKEPRIHFAINCASMSCPPLQAQPYTGEGIDAQLNKATSAFVNDASANRLEGETLRVSKIFDWLSEDFNGDVLSFFVRYAEDPLRSELVEKRERIKIAFNRYDWSLNAVRGGGHG